VHIASLGASDGAENTIATLGIFSDATDFDTGTLMPDGREVYVLGIEAD
jgi:hypothetical protein